MMPDYRRYAIYWAPAPGPLAEAAATWLGWDPASATETVQPALPVPLADWTAEPRKYGFHGTLKAPFRLAEGWDRARLSAAVADLARSLAPVDLPEVVLRRIGSFLALVPGGGEAALSDLGARIVSGLDPARAPLTEGEIARRRPERLTPHQRALLTLWGYPYVMEEFRFHLTLSGSLPPEALDQLEPLATAHFAPHLPRPFGLTQIALFGEAADGRFHLLEPHALTG